MNTEEIRIVVPVAPAHHPMLAECVRNIRATTGREPVVWESEGNVAVARNEALDALGPGWTIFVDTDAFPAGDGWDRTLVRSAREAGAVIASGREFFDFGDSRTALGGTERRVGLAWDCAGALLAVDATRCEARFDEALGYASGTLGPCIEDTDFARAVGAAGGARLYEPGVCYLHKDRGAADMEGFLATDEALCYGIVSMIIDAKWSLGIPDLCKGIGRVPADGRWLRRGVSRERLFECYAPVAEKLPRELRGRFLRKIGNEIWRRFRDR